MKRLLLLMILLFVCFAAACAGAEAWASGLPEEFVPVLKHYATGLAADEEPAETDEPIETCRQYCLPLGIDPLDSIGYCFADLNGDAVPELVIGSMPGSALPVGFIFEIQALRDQDPVRLIRGWERYRVHMIYDESADRYGYYAESASSAFESVYEYAVAAEDMSGWTDRHVIEAVSSPDDDSVRWALDGAEISGDEAYDRIERWQYRCMELPMSPIREWTLESVQARAELERRFGFVDDQTPGTAETFRRSFQLWDDGPVLDVVIKDTGRRRPEEERENVLQVNVSARDGSLEQTFEYAGAELPDTLAMGSMAFLDDMNRDGKPDLVLTTARGAYNEFFVFCLWNAPENRFDPVMTTRRWDWEANALTDETIPLELCDYAFSVSKQGFPQLVSCERDGYAETRTMVYEWLPLGRALTLKEAVEETNE